MVAMAISELYAK